MCFISGWQFRTAIYILIVISHVSYRVKDRLENIKLSELRAAVYSVVWWESLTHKRDNVSYKNIAGSWEALSEGNEGSSGLQKHNEELLWRESQGIMILQQADYANWESCLGVAFYKQVQQGRADISEKNTPIRLKSVYSSLPADFHHERIVNHSLKESWNIGNYGCISILLQLGEIAF